MTNKNLDVLLVAILIFVIQRFAPTNLGFLWWLFLPIQLGWIGTEIAFLRDSYGNKKNWIVNFGKYMWKYFKKFLPIVLLYLLLLILVIVTGIVLIILKVKLPTMSFIELLNTYKLEVVTTYLILSPLSAFAYAFNAVIVIRDIPFFRGLSQSYIFLRQNKKFYLLLIGLSVLPLALHVLRSVLFNATLFTTSPDVLGFSFAAISLYLNLFIASLCVLYISKQ